MIPVRLHAALDGASAAALAAVPTLLGWPVRLRGPLAMAGAGVAAYSLATRYRSGGRGVISLSTHLAIDTAQGIGFCIAAAALRDQPRQVRYAMAGYGVFSVAAAALTRPEAKSGERR
jgi:hypothetical protein